MKLKEEMAKSTFLKILLPIVAIVIIIGLWQSGYEFGQWLHKVVN